MLHLFCMTVRMAIVVDWLLLPLLLLLLVLLLMMKMLRRLRVELVGLGN